MRRIPEILLAAVLASGVLLLTSAALFLVATRTVRCEGCVSGLTCNFDVDCGSPMCVCRNASTGTPGFCQEGADQAAPPTRDPSTFPDDPRPPRKPVNPSEPGPIPRMDPPDCSNTPTDPRCKT